MINSTSEGAEIHQVQTRFSKEEVANLLYEQLPMENRLPGSPSLMLTLEAGQVVLRQELIKRKSGATI